MTREKQRKRPGRRRPVTIQDIGDVLPPNVAVLPRRVRHYATWADLIASYEPRPGEPGKVLAFVPPPRTPVP